MTETVFHHQPQEHPTMKVLVQVDVPQSSLPPGCQDPAEAIWKIDRALPDDWTITAPKTLLVAFCPNCGVISDLDSSLGHTRGCTQPTIQITNRLRTIHWRRDRKRDGWYADDIDYLLSLLAGMEETTAHAQYIEDFGEPPWDRRRLNP
jgi:hypothetical protein